MRGRRGEEHSSLSTALSNAHWVIAVEHDAHLGIEGSLQRALHFEPASWLLSNVDARGAAALMALDDPDALAYDDGQRDVVCFAARRDLSEQ